MDGELQRVYLSYSPDSRRKLLMGTLAALDLLPGGTADDVVLLRLTKLQIKLLQVLVREELT
jgi:hypothetical protein